MTSIRGVFTDYQDTFDPMRYDPMLVRVMH